MCDLDTTGESSTFRVILSDVVLVRMFCKFIITDKVKLVGEEVKGVGVMKDEEL